MPDKKKRPLFRETALQHYFHRREKDILPRLVKPPVFICGWIILALLSFMVFLAWWQEVPLFARGSAVSLRPNADGQTLLVVLPARYQDQARMGNECHIRFQSAEPYHNCKITHVVPATTDPKVLQQQYHLDGTISLKYQQPLVALEVQMPSEVTRITHEGELAQARIQIGSQRILSLLPDVAPGE